MTTPDGQEKEPMSENVTRIHPAPSIPNPLKTDQWAVLTDAELAEEVARAEARIDAAQHTLAALERERARRATDGQEKNR